MVQCATSPVSWMSGCRWTAAIRAPRVETIDRMPLLPSATAENGGQDAAGGNGGNTCTETCGGKHPRPQAPIAKTMIRSTNMPHLKQ